VGGLQASLVAAGQPGTSVSAAMRLLLLVAAVAQSQVNSSLFFSDSGLIKDAATLF
jgi:hypothetical protein